MSEKQRFLTEEEFNKIVEEGKMGLSVAYKQGKERRTRRDVITALSGGIEKMINEGLSVADIVAALSKTGISKVMKEGTIRTYVMQVCGKKPKKRKSKMPKAAKNPVSTPASATGNQGVTV